MSSLIVNGVAGTTSGGTWTLIGPIVGNADGHFKILGTSALTVGTLISCIGGGHLVPVTAPIATGSPSINCVGAPVAILGSVIACGLNHTITSTSQSHFVA